ncbi:hypothetical protein EW146_g8286 [Bondarzewia mesenterica]|uniref:DUF6535 domain-containing protein n=1 Tax=Bondarzewia mesenterica TaxID=1095465 RepID=A0A4S4LG92_9AGAM|nr:hypothetical protein EW146_g8286 [Bondarzewia mesenterica]
MSVNLLTVSGRFFTVQRSVLGGSSGSSLASCDPDHVKLEARSSKHDGQKREIQDGLVRGGRLGGITRAPAPPRPVPGARAAFKFAPSKLAIGTIPPEASPPLFFVSRVQHSREASTMAIEESSLDIEVGKSCAHSIYVLDPPVTLQNLEDVERSSKIWSIYVNESQKFDKALVESWKGDMDANLIFAGLFSACVTAFLIQSYQLLQPGSNSINASLLSQISQAMSGSTNRSTDSASLPSASTDSSIPASAIRVNILWFLSLLSSLLCALCATLIQQWARNYTQAIERRSLPHQRGRIRAFLFHGIQQSRLKAFVDGVPTLLHLSLFLFFGGIYDFLAPINEPIALMVLIVVSIYGAGYILIGLQPLFGLDIPYQTPMSAPMWRVKQLVWPLRYHDFHDKHVVMQGNLAHGREEYAMHASQGCKERDLEALSWILDSLTEDDELEAFVEGIPGFLSSGRVVDGMSIMHALMKHGHLGDKIVKLLESCASSAVDFVAPRRARALTCLTTISALSRELTSDEDSHKWSLFFDSGTAAAMMRLRTVDDPVVVIHAHCTIAIMFWRLFSDYDELTTRAKHSLFALERHVSPMPAKGAPGWRFIRSSDSLDLAIKELKQKLGVIRTSMIAPWFSSMHTILDHLCSHFADAPQLPPSTKDFASYLKYQTSRATQSHFHLTRERQKEVLRDIESGNLSMLTSVLQYLAVHARTVGTVLELKLEHQIKDSFKELGEILEQWNSKSVKDLVSKMVDAGHVANLIQLVSGALNNSHLSATEYKLVLETLGSVQVPLSASRLDQRTQAHLLTLLRFVKNEHTVIVQRQKQTTKLEDASPRAAFLMQVTERLTPAVTLALNTPGLLINARNLLTRYQRDCPVVRDVVSRALTMINDKLTPTATEGQVVLRRRAPHQPHAESAPTRSRIRRIRTVEDQAVISRQIRVLEGRNVSLPFITWLEESDEDDLFAYLSGVELDQQSRDLISPMSPSTPLPRDSTGLESDRITWQPDPLYEALFAYDDNDASSVDSRIRERLDDALQEVVDLIDAVPPLSTASASPVIPDGPVEREPYTDRARADDDHPLAHSAGSRGHLEAPMLAQRDSGFSEPPDDGVEEVPHLSTLLADDISGIRLSSSFEADAGDDVGVKESSGFDPLPMFLESEPSLAVTASQDEGQIGGGEWIRSSEVSDNRRDPSPDDDSRPVEVIDWYSGL